LLKRSTNSVEKYQFLTVISQAIYW